MTLRIPRVAALLFCSGLCALVYQVAWFRELRLIFGASTASSAAVLAIFMGGLGLGGAMLGKRADTSPNPLAMYAKLEIAVACGAGATPALVWLADKVYLAAGGTLSLGAGGATLLRVLLSVIVLGPVTFLMGGTLPAAAKAVERDDDGARRSVATLYGVNTLGAVTGVVLANFFLLEVLGTRMTLWMAALVNLLVGVVARSLSRSASAAADPSRPLPASAAPSTADDAAPDAQHGIPGWFPPAAAALAGGSFMLMELTWYRMLAPLLGGSSYTFGLILAVALVGIAIGGGAYARTRVPATLRWFAITCSLEALFIAIPFALGDHVAIVTALLRPLCHIGFAQSTVVWAAVAAFVVLPAAIVSGLQFPLIIGLYGRGGQKVGRDVGAAYLANTAGSIVGSLAGGFGLIPLLGALGSWKLVVVSLSMGATVALFVDVRRRGGDKAGPLHTRSGLGVALAWIPSLLLLAGGPSNAWRHSGIGAGRADVKLENAGPGTVRAFKRAQQRTVRWEADGVESTVALDQGNGYTFVVNGKADGHAIVDAPTQVMSGMLAALVHGDPKSALVVGLGTGSTAGWLGAVPSIEKVDVVELEPAILRVARDCAPVNQSVMDNPKVHIHLADARELLRTTRSRYDIIFSEPSNPYRAGISSLYTVEYYRAAAERVAPGGMFVQWLQGYEVDGWVLATAIVTLRQVFADVEVWRTMGGDLLLVARAEHKQLDLQRLRASMLTEPYATALANVWRTATVEGVLSHFVANAALGSVLVERGLGAVNTDDQNFLEFAFARSVGHHRRVDDDLLSLAKRLGHHLPDVVGTIDTARVQEEAWLFQGFQGVPLRPTPSPPPKGGLGPIVVAAGANQNGPALAMWKKLGRERPRSLAEGSILAEAAARAGTAEDAALIEYAPPAERDVLRAFRASRSSDFEAVASALTRTFVAARTNPWIQPRLIEASLALAADTASRAPATGPALHAALAEPFAVELARDQRMVTRAAIAMGLPDPAACVAAFDALEPPPWIGEVLVKRAACYTRANDPRAALAKEDELEILERDLPLGSSIPSPPRPARPAPTPAADETPPAGADAAAPSPGAVDAGGSAR